MTLRLAGSTVALADRALVAGVVPGPRFARESEVLAAAAAVRQAGADLADVSLAPRLVGPAVRRSGLPVVARVSTVGDARDLAAAGVSVILVPPAGAAELAGALVPAGGQVAVVVDDLGALREAAVLAGDLGAPLALDTSGWSPIDALAGESVAVTCGCRIVRTADVRRTRRVVEVVASLVEARRGA